MRKSIQYLLLGIASALTCVGFAACNGGNQSSDDPVEVTFEQNEIKLALGDTFQLKAFADGEESNATWQVNGDSITVDESGFLSAVRVGNATVTATIDGESATCSVSISAPDVVPMVTYNVGESLLIKAGAPYQIIPTLVLDGERVTADTLTCEIEDGALLTAKSAGNTCTLTGVAVGETTVTLVCDWKGVELYKQITVSIASGEEVVLSDLSVDIYAYGTDTAKTVTVKSIRDKDGKALADKTVEWATLDESIATVNGGVITAKSVGVTTVTATWKNADGESVTAYCAVNVNPVIVQVEGKQKLSIGDETVGFDLTPYIPDDTFTWEKVVEETADTEISFTVANNAITLNKTQLSVGEDKVFRFESTEGITVKLTADLLTKLIRTRAELLNWTDYAPLVGDNYGGYFELGNNIIFADGEETNDVLTAGYVVPNFAGTFDGKGFTIVGGKWNRGLFGDVVKGGIIRNVAVVNVKTHGSDGSGGHQFGVFAHKMSGLMENVCVVYHESGLVWQQHGLVGRLEGATLKNVIVHATDNGKPGLEKTFCGAYANYLNATSISEVYVVGVPQNRIVVQHQCNGWNRYDNGTTCADIGWVAGENNFGAFWDFSGEKPCFTSYNVNA